VVLRDERNVAKANVADVQEKIAKVENDAAASSAAAEKWYEAYQAEVKKGLALLRESYEVGVNGIGSWCTPLDDASSSTEDFLRWFKAKVASLPEVFIDTNDNFVSIALEGVLEMARHQNAADFTTLRAGTSTCDMTIFLDIHREVKRTVRRIIKDWWRKFGFKEAKQIVHAKIRQVS
jgi:hypothetical protein